MSEVSAESDPVDKTAADPVEEDQDFSEEEPAADEDEEDTSELDPVEEDADELEAQGKFKFYVNKQHPSYLGNSL